VAPIVGTDRLGRRFTDEERRHFEQLLREHGFANARLYALLFARKLARGNAAAEDLVGRACLRLVRWGWDPNEVPLATRLARLVWSEWTHAKAETDAARRAERAWARELRVTEGRVAKSAEDSAVGIEDEREEEERNRENIEKLRAAMVKAKDDVNLLWLGYTLEGKTDQQEMARLSGRDVKEFYAATKRRTRMVARLAAEARGVMLEEDEKDEDRE
jgi:hypothetical protein